MEESSQISLIYRYKPIRDPKDSISNFLELINSFSRVAGYKSQHTKISRLFTYINNKHATKEIRKIKLLVIASSGQTNITKNSKLQEYT